MSEHVDVLIVGAGISGVCAAYHLGDKCPDKSIAILEARDAIGGTWDLFRYPGIRSDSDMYTLGFRFHPWPDAKAIADGPAIRKYVRETASEYGIDRDIRFHHRVVSAEWSTEDARWTVGVERTDTGETVEFTCGFLFLCGGYYRYDGGYTPDFEGTDRFAGQIVHPQQWPEDLDYDGKRVIVIGSGATAVTLVPAMAERAAHVTMLQRSPSYVVSLPGTDPIAGALRRILPQKVVYPLVRWKNVAMTMFSFQLSRRRPRLAKALLRKGVERHLPPGYDTKTHFRPRYDPWDQRLCLVPDADLFEALSDGSASIVTDVIDTFTERGVKVGSGDEIEADLVVTATGLNLVPLAGVALTVDGEEAKLPEKLGYKGMMLSGVPNMAYAVGYTNASWTLKCELTCEYVCRLLNHMDEQGYTVCTPNNRDPSVTPEPFIDFNSGYVLRAIDSFPKQGSRRPWKLYQNYALDLLSLRLAPLEDGALDFEGAPTRSLGRAREEQSQAPA
jgi:cation diffusion facilitator CzcD-associated flavoprotein CzcO